MDLSEVLVTGSHGMLGRSIDFGLKLSRIELDVTDSNSIENAFKKYKPKAILHLAALDLRQCESDPIKACQVNIEGVLNLSHLAKEQNLPLYYISTGAVFDGPVGKVFYEEEKPSPLNLYGETKYVAEQIIQSLVPRHLIVRTGWVFGGHGAHHKKLVDRAIEAKSRDSQFKGNGVQTGSPTSIYDFLSELRTLIESDVTGVRHVINSGVGTALDMLKLIKKISGNDFEILEVNPEEIEKTPQRSISECLGTRFHELRPWQEALTEYVNEKIR